jgi:transcriptional regulator with XRE-family HTH domain
MSFTNGLAQQLLAMLDTRVTNLQHPRVATPTDPYYERVGERVRTRRQSKRITQEALAVALGVNRTTLVNIEKGRQRLAVHQLVRIADHLGCPAAELIPSNEEDTLLSDRQRSNVRDEVALGFVRDVAAEARRGR